MYPGVKVLKLVHELKAKDIEEYRKKIVERDKNKDEEKDIGEERRMVVEKGERRKREEEDEDQSEDRVSSPAAVFTFDQEDIHTSKLLSFEKVIKLSQCGNLGFLALKIRFSTTISL